MLNGLNKLMQRRLRIFIVPGLFLFMGFLNSVFVLFASAMVLQWLIQTREVVLWIGLPVLFGKSALMFIVEILGAIAIFWMQSVLLIAYVIYLKFAKQ